MDSGDAAEVEKFTKIFTGCRRDYGRNSIRWGSRLGRGSKLRLRALLIMRVRGGVNSTGSVGSDGSN